MKLIPKNHKYKIVADFDEQPVVNYWEYYLKWWLRLVGNEAENYNR